MSAAYASGRIAWGLCDRCGERNFLRDLRRQMIDQKDSGLLVCPACLDVDHPQYRLGKTPIFDPQALRNPRMDPRQDVTNNFVFSGAYTASGAPIFTLVVTPSTGTLRDAGVAPTTRRN